MVESLPIYVQDKTDWGGDSMSEAPGYRAIRRSDTKEVFQVATEGYQIYQNRDLANLAMAIGTEAGAKVESAGTLRNGRDVFFLLQTGSFVLPGVEDENRSYALLRNSHDGSCSLQVFPTTIRVVCKNTWNYASMHQRQGSSFRHTANLHERVADGVKAIQNAREIAKQTEKVAEQLVSIPISSQQSRDYFAAVLDSALGTPNTDRGRTMRKNQLIDIFQAEYHRSNDNIRGTRWGAFNAVSYWTDHVHQARGMGNGKYSRLFGTGAEIKKHALALAMA